MITIIIPQQDRINFLLGDAHCIIASSTEVSLFLSGECPASGTLREQRRSNAYTDCVGWDIDRFSHLTLRRASSGLVQHRGILPLWLMFLVSEGRPIK